MSRPQAIATQQADDARVRVTRFDFEAGAETGWHIHAMDYVITAVTDCHMTLEEPDGTTRSTFVAAGQSYTRCCGVEHNVINGGTGAMCFVEVELK